MIYMGSKRRIAKHILPIMLAAASERGITRWVEPFVGGGNSIDKVPQDFERIGYDINEHAIMAMLDIRDRAESLPDTVTEAEYKAMRGTPPATVTSSGRGLFARLGHALRRDMLGITYQDTKKQQRSGRWQTP